MWHAWERREKCTRFWWESPKERPLGRPRRRWEDGIKMDLREVGLGCVDWIQDRDRWRAVVSAVMNLRVLAPQRASHCPLHRMKTVPSDMKISGVQ
jgi:hypothetical protein